jgi:hypothetical protein
VPRKPAVLFVCLGNICRSPLAEAAFRAEVVRMGLDVEVDSAGVTGSPSFGSVYPARQRAICRPIAPTSIQSNKRMLSSKQHCERPPHELLTLSSKPSLTRWMNSPPRMRNLANSGYRHQS